MAHRATPDFDIAVQSILRHSVNTILRPAAADIKHVRIEEKKPEDFVTETDRAMERDLSRQLQALLPGSLVLGEEGCFENPEDIDRLLNVPEPVWIIDPIDGTRHFIRQDGEYGPMVALLQNGDVRDAWIYIVTRPDDGILSLRTMEAYAAGTTTRERPLGTLNKETRESMQAGFEALGLDSTPGSQASCSVYRRLILGETDFYVTYLTQPWDHFAGLAITHKLGFTALQWSGEPATFTGRNHGLIVARTYELAQRILVHCVAPVVARNGLPYRPR